MVLAGGKYSDEGALVSACLRGDVQAERELFRREYPRVNATVYRILGSSRELDDLVQETFVAVYRALPRFRGESKLSTWIDRICVRTVFHHIRSRPQVTVDLAVIAEPALDGPSPSEQVQAREGVRRLYGVLAGLSTDMRVAFALHAIDGRPIADVAKLVGASTVATKLRIWRARREIEKRAAADPVLAQYLTAAASTGSEDEP